MKKSILSALLVLTLFTMTGCGCRNSKPVPTTVPTTMPATTAPTTEMTTVPTTEMTLPSTSPTIEDGNGPLPSGPVTDGSTEAGRNRSMTGTGTGISGSITG